MYRGTTKDGREVFGWLVCSAESLYFDTNNLEAGRSNAFIVEHKDLDIDFCLDGGRYNLNAYFHHVVKHTLAMKTRKTDKHNTDIYGSFMLNGKMTNGGDLVKSDAFDFDEIYLYKTMDYKVEFYGGTWIMKAKVKTVPNRILHSIGSGLLEIIKENRYEV